jgi:hypothetical protein
VKNNQGQFISQEFQAEISISIQFKKSDFNQFKNAMIKLSRGEISPPIISTNPDTIFPLDVD